MFDVNDFIKKWEKSVPKETRDLVEDFFSSNGVGRRYLFGRNEHSAALSKVVDVDGFIDDFADPNTTYFDKPVIKSEEIPRNVIIVNCVLMAKSLIVTRKIKSLDVDSFISYSDLYRVLLNESLLPRFALETRSDLLKNNKKWELLNSSLQDAQSKKVLNDVLKYRLTCDYSFMSDYSYVPLEQYFDKIIKCDSGEIFVDIGGYEGETTQEFCKRCPKYGKVYFYEPSLVNIIIAKKTLSQYKSIKFIDKGLSDVKGKAYFDDTSGSACSVVESGSCQIDITTLDNDVRDKVTFIKMDIEGYELKALKGAERHIIDDHPKLAISVYHHASDFWRIFDFVISLRQDYNVYIRHYTEGWTETVMYFIPIL